ncbi:MAG TPA: family 10 glycosylhydrolase [Pyrinomonadaceae bacterium]
MNRKFFISLIVFMLCAAARAETPPAPAREFRAVWIATVDNIDFPSKKNLSIDEQKAEIVRDLDLARELKMNAVIFQVRPMCDAIYASRIEPWSEFLTGEMGRAQSFDPLSFIIDEGHKRGILVHAWFNPYRAFHPAAKTVSPNHISKRRPDLVRRYGKYLWLDPTDAEVQKYSLSVILDVVKRYDVDGVHFDDYFYPYAEKDADGNKIEFPDDKNWQKYLDGLGNLADPIARDDWRRNHVNRFIAAVGRETKRLKPEVMYGISPFGVAEENYKNLYADAEKWLREGWVDYFVPQIYWKSDRPNREFAPLLKHWENVNEKNRHVWAGIGTYKIPSKTENFSAAEIVHQISLTREIQRTAGNIQFSFKSVRSDFDKIQNALREKPYRSEAIIPLSPWIKSAKPLAPRVKITRDAETVRAAWRENGKRKAFWFVVYAKDANGWSYSILPAAQKSIALSAGRKIEKVIVTSVDRLGNESKR